MNTAFLLLFLLRNGASAPRPTSVRVAFSPLTKAAYMQALKGKIAFTPRVTFPLKKQQGRLVIPSTKGPHVFRDGWVDGERDEDTQYKYLGYWPELRWHLVEGYHFSEVYRLNALTQNGQWLRLEDSPAISPDTSQFVVASGALDGIGTPTIQLFQRKEGAWQQVWKVESRSWQVEEVEWVAANALVLQQKHWNKTFSRAWYTYARLTIQDQTKN
ncbi:hypothetical protein [Hymenobacter sp. UYCo722]|uniref:hypothetical protein n=1 Tax=Hymenobacter sp. UYCo722 TaxID=3156335 RepID=UPI003397A535